jgi:hypothetical protein
MDEYLCSNVGCGRLGPPGSCKECGWTMRPLKHASDSHGIPDSESSDPNVDSDPDDGGD